MSLADGVFTVVSKSIDADQPRTSRARFDGKDVLAWDLGGEGDEPWRLSRKETLMADGRFQLACCAGVEGDIPEEYAYVAEGVACPPAP